MGCNEQLERAAAIRQISKQAMNNVMQYCVTPDATAPGHELLFDQIDLHPVSQDNTDHISRRKFDPYIQWPTTGETILPVIAANMHGIGTIEMARAVNFEQRGIMVALDKSTYTAEQLISFFKEDPAAKRAALTTGLRQEDQEKFNIVVDQVGKNNIHTIRMDVPHGGLSAYLSRIQDVRKQCPNAFLMAGNLVCPELTKTYFDLGVDAAVIGVGPGDLCTTRTETGFSHAQLSAVIKCAEVADQMNKFIIADGGTKEDGDIAKAIGVGGALAVMVGSRLAGYDEGEVINLRDVTPKNLIHFREHANASNDHIEPDVTEAFEKSGFGEALRKGLIRFDNKGELQIQKRGSSSSAAMIANYGQQDVHQAAEGRTDWTPYKGSVSTLFNDITGHLRSALSYGDMPSREDLTKTPGLRLLWSLRHS